MRRYRDETTQVHPAPAELPASFFEQLAGLVVDLSEDEEDVADQAERPPKARGQATAAARPAAGRGKRKGRAGQSRQRRSYATLIVRRDREEDWCRFG
jgi:hypothetical protein